MKRFSMPLYYHMTLCLLWMAIFPCPFTSGLVMTCSGPWDVSGGDWAPLSPKYTHTHRGQIYRAHHVVSSSLAQALEWRCVEGASQSWQTADKQWELEQTSAAVLSSREPNESYYNDPFLCTPSLFYIALAFLGPVSIAKNNCFHSWILFLFIPNNSRLCMWPKNHDIRRGRGKKKVEGEQLPYWERKRDWVYPRSSGDLALLGKRTLARTLTRAYTAPINTRVAPSTPRQKTPASTLSQWFWYLVPF